MPISQDKITSVIREIPRIQNALLQNTLLEIRKLHRYSINSNLFHARNARENTCIETHVDQSTDLGALKTRIT